MSTVGLSVFQRFWDISLSTMWLHSFEQQILTAHVCSNSSAPPPLVPNLLKPGLVVGPDGDDGG